MSGVFSLLVLGALASSEEDLVDKLAAALAEGKETKDYGKAHMHAHLFLIKQAIGDDFHKAMEMIEASENPMSIISMGIKARMSMDDEPDESGESKKDKKKRKKSKEDSED